MQLLRAQSKTQSQDLVKSADHGELLLTTSTPIDAIGRAGIPLVLIATKCDALFEERQLDPTNIENTAKRSLRNLITVQTSAGVPETHKRSLSMILRSIITAPKGKVQCRNCPGFRYNDTRNVAWLTSQLAAYRRPKPQSFSDATKSSFERYQASITATAKETRARKLRVCHYVA